jgi:hypothetical protein
MCSRRRPLQEFRRNIDGKRASLTCIHCERIVNREKLRCSKCRQVKPPEEFYWKPDGKLRYSHCKDCQLAYMQQWQRENREKYNEWQRRNRRAKRLGLTIEEFETLEPPLSLVCEGCGANVSDVTGRRLPADHDHETELLRGVLCSKCNQALGMLNDDPSLLRRLADYLERPPRWPGVKVKPSRGGTTPRRKAA